MISKIVLALALLCSTDVYAAGSSSRVLQATAVQNGSGQLKIPTSTPTASRACYFDSSSIPTASSVTSTELGYLSGVTSSLCGTAQVCSPTNKTFDTTNSATLKTSAFTLVDGTDTTKKNVEDLSLYATGTTYTWQKPAQSDQYVGRTVSQLLLNKQLQDSTTVFYNATSSTKKIRFDSSNVTAGNTRIIKGPDADGMMILDRNYAYQKHYFNDFEEFGDQVGTPRWTVSAGGGTISQDASVESNSAIGVTKFSTSTSTSANPYGAGPRVIIGDGTFYMEWKVRLSALSGGSDTFGLRFGVSNAVGAADPAEGLYWKYLQTTSVNWQCIARHSSTTTTNDTGVAVDINTWHKFEILYDSSAGTATCYIDGVAKGSAISTNLPANFVAMFVDWDLWKLSGTTAINMWSDYMGFDQYFTTSR